MLKAARAEVQRLEAELAATEAYQKLQLAKQVVKLYEGIPSQGEKQVDLLSLGFQKHRGRQATDTKTARIEAAAAEYLKKKSARAPASELLGEIEKRGVSVGGKDPVKALSSYLSSSKTFNNQRELGGYGLAEWGHSRGPLTETGA